MDRFAGLKRIMLGSATQASSGTEGTRFLDRNSVMMGGG
jgi:hypothetical protein